MNARMPEAVRKTMVLAVVALAITAAVGNLGHVYDFAHSEDHGDQDEGQSVVAAMLPDVLLVLCVIRLRYDRSSPWAWSGLVASVTAVVWASVAMADETWTARAVAVWPVLVAVIAAGLMEAKGEPEVAAVTPAKIAPPVRRTPAATPPKAVAPKATPDTPPAVSPQVTGGGTVAARIVAVLEDGAKTRADLVALTGAADGTVKKELTKLKESGTIEQDPTKAHHWRAHVALRAVAR